MKSLIVFALTFLGSSAFAQYHLACSTDPGSGSLQQEINEWIGYGYSHISAPFLSVDSLNGNLLNTVIPGEK